MTSPALEVVVVPSKSSGISIITAVVSSSSASDSFNTVNVHVSTSIFPAISPARTSAVCTPSVNGIIGT